MADGIFATLIAFLVAGLMLVVGWNAHESGVIRACKHHQAFYIGDQRFECRATELKSPQ